MQELLYFMAWDSQEENPLKSQQNLFPIAQALTPSWVLPCDSPVVVVPTHWEMEISSQAHLLVIFRHMSRPSKTAKDMVND